MSLWRRETAVPRRFGRRSHSRSRARTPVGVPGRASGLRCGRTQRRP